MARNNDLVVTAGLNIDASVAQIEKDLKQVNDRLSAGHALKIIANVDLSKTTQRINSQLATISKNLNLNIGNVQVSANTSNVVSQMNNISAAANNTKQSVQSVEQSLANLGKIKPFSPQTDKNGLYNVKATLTYLEKTLSALDGVESVTTLGRIDDTGKLSQPLREIEATIVSTTGEVRKLNFEYKQFEDMFFATKGSVSDSGVLKQAEQLSKFVDQYTSKLNSLRSQVNESFAPNITATLNQGAQQVNVTFDSLLQKINALASGTGSVEEVRAEFTALESTVNSLNSVLGQAQGKGFNRFDNAEISAREFENTLTKIKLDIDNLNPANSEVSQLSNQFKYLNNEVKNLLSNSNRDSAWIEQFATISIKLKEIENQVKIIKQFESKSDDSATRKQAEALDEIVRAYREIRSLTTKGEAGTELRAEAEKEIAIQGEIVNATVQRLQNEGLLSKDIQKQIQLYENEISVINTLAIAKQNDINAQKAASDALKQQKQIYSSLIQDVRTYTNALNNFNNAGAVKKNSGNTGISNQVAQNVQLLEQLKAIFNELSVGFDKLPTDKLNDLNNRFNAIRNSLQTAKDSSEAFKRSLTDNKISQDAVNKLNNLTNQINIFANANKKAIESTKAMRDGTSFADEWQRIVTTLKSGNLDNNGIQQLAQDFRNFKGEAESAGLSVNKLFASMQSQLRLVLQRWISLYAVVRYIREMVDSVKSLDTAMINLKRVTDATDESYKQFIDDADKQARALKTTTSSLIEQAYQWAKLGYDMQDSLELANASTIFMRVADVDQTQALSNLVTTLKAYRIEAEDTIDVVDKLDKLNNEFAVSAAGLGEGLERSASSLYMTGNTLDQSLALLTGAGEITQNLENTGNALKVVALRLQGMKGQLEELQEPVDDLMEVSKIQTQILNLTKNQVDIYDQANDKFRSTYDILKDVSEIWDTLSSTERASLTEIMFGKLRANQGLAIIQAFQSGQIEKAYEASINAAGTATKENEEMMKGIEAHINALRGAFEELSNAIIDSGFLNTIIDSGKTILNILTWITKNLGTLTTIGAGVGLFAGFKNVGLFNLSAIKEATVAFTAYNMQLKIGNQHLATQTALQGTENASLRTYIANLNGAKASLGSYTAYLVKTKVATVALRVATIALNTALTMGISLAIQGIGTLIDKLIVTEDELNEISSNAVNDMNELADSIKKFNSEKAEVADLVQQYQNLASSTGDISSNKDELLKIQESLVEKYGDEAKSLDLVNGKYDDQIAKIKALSDAEYEEWKIKNADKIAKAEKMAGYNVGWYQRDEHSGKLVSNNQYDQNFLKGGVQWEDELAASLYKVKGVSQDIQDIWQDIEGIEFVDGIFSNDLYLSGMLEDAKEQLRQLIQALTDAGADDKVLKPLVDQFTTIDQALEDIATYGTEKGKSVVNVVDNIKQVTTKAFNDITNVVAVSSDELTTKWLENLDEMQKGSLKNVSTMVSALQDLSEGKGIAANTFWSLIEFDEEGLLNGAKLIGDKFYVAQENMIKLKDQYILKQIESIAKDNEQNRINKEMAESQIRSLEAQRAALPLSDKIYNSEAYRNLTRQLEVAKNNAKVYGDLWERNNWLIEYFNQTLGNTVDLQKQLEAQQKQLNKELTALNKELDNYTKAYEAKIDAIVKGLELELSELEEQKDVLEDELDVLEKQQDVLEETLDNYEKVNSYAQKIIDKEIEGLEEQRDAIKNTYDERINALKAENEEREDALDYAQKLANLENARNNKRRVYDEARGWRYESVKEDVVKAESDLKTFENNQQVKSLEKERDAEIKAWDALIKQKEDYKKQWAEWLEEIQLEESEALAQEILGADWREKIAERDINLIDSFAEQYRKHNADLRNLTETEIKLKKASIDAKNAEIDAKKKQITVWKDYKTQLTTAVSEIKQANEGYMAQIGQIELNETSSLERRDQEFEKFKNNVTNYIDQIGQKQSMIDNVTAALDQISGGDYRLSFEVEGYDQLTNVENTLQRIVDKMKGVQILNAAEIAQMMDEVGIGDVAYGEKMAAFLRKLLGYSSGGVADYTGLAMLHGRKNAPETIFNANDSAKLYEMVHNTPSVMADMLTQAHKLAGFKVANNESTNNSNVTFYIDKIVTDNPVDFEKQLDRYYRTKLTQSYTSKQ